ETPRRAVASGRVRMLPATLTLIRDKSVSKGDVLEVARLAGIMAAKRTAGLIPLCHPLPLTSVQLDFAFDGNDALRITATAEVVASTNPGLARLIQHLDQYRGKRLRPVVLLLTAHACGRVTPTHHVLGAVVEMVHTATLVHDDVLDEADLRRHVPTVNAGWG